MFQAVFNTKNRDKKEKTFFWNKITRPIGILFFLSILSTTFISSWIVLSCMKKDKQHLLSLRLVVTGGRHYTRYNDIRQAILELDFSEGFIMQDVNIIQNQIERLPWVKQVTVKKQWPDQLKIHLIEYSPIANWNNQYMVDMDGNLFSIPNDRDNHYDLPNLYGPEGSDGEVLQNFNKIKRVLSKKHFTLKLKSLVMTSRHSWKLTLTNGIKLNLGRSDIIERLSRFLVLYPILQQEENSSRKRIYYVDLRYDSGAAVAWESSMLRKSNRQQASLRAVE